MDCSMKSWKKRERATESVNGNLALSVYDDAKLYTKTTKSKTWIDRDELLRKDRRYWYVRRTQDVILSLAALIVLFVPMLLVAFIIWIIESEELQDEEKEPPMPLDMSVVEDTIDDSTPLVAINTEEDINIEGLLQEP